MISIIIQRRKEEEKTMGKKSSVSHLRHLQPYSAARHSVTWGDGPQVSSKMFSYSEYLNI